MRVEGGRVARPKTEGASDRNDQVAELESRKRVVAPELNQVRRRRARFRYVKTKPGDKRGTVGGVRAHAGPDDACLLRRTHRWWWRVSSSHKERELTERHVLDFGIRHVTGACGNGVLAVSKR